jgi:hypothetical protein
MFQSGSSLRHRRDAARTSGDDAVLNPMPYSSPRQDYPADVQRIGHGWR